jgi:hypothetical protein
MKKLLGLMVCFCAGIVLTMGTTGCTTKKDKTTTVVIKTTTVNEATTTPKTTPTPPTTPTPTTPTPTTPTPTTPVPKTPTEPVVTKKEKLEVSEVKPVKIKQGEKADIKVVVTMGPDLKDVKITVAVSGKETKGFTASVTPEKLTKSGDVVTTIMVADTVPEGEYTVTVTAAVGDAMVASKTMVTVTKK